MNKYVVEVNEAGQVVGQPQPYSPQPISQEMTWSGVIFWGITAVLVVGLILKCIVIVKQQSVKIIERLGKFNRVATAGLSFRIPLLDNIVDEVDLRIGELSEDVTAKTSDNVFVSVPVKVQYQVIETMAKEAYYALSEAKKQINSYIVNIVRSEATSMTMEEVFKSKSIFEDAVSTNLNEKFGAWGFKVVNVLVDNPVPSKEVVASFDKVISSQRLREAATNEAEAIRIKTVANARAEAESLTLKSEAYVKQRTTMAKGMAGVISEEKMGDYLVGIDIRDMVRDASQHGAVILVPISYEGKIAETVASLKALKQ